MSTLLYWYVALVAAATILPYALGIPPRTERDRRAVAIAIGFLTWLLAGFVSLRSLCR